MMIHVILALFNLDRCLASSASSSTSDGVLIATFRLGELVSAASSQTFSSEWTSEYFSVGGWVDQYCVLMKLKITLN